MATVYVFNIGPEEWHYPRPYGTISVPACEDGRPFVVKEINDHKDRTDLGEDKFYMHPVPGEDIAAEIVADIGRFGVWSSGKPAVNEADLEAAKERRLETMRQIIQQGDGFWNASRDLRSNGITGLHMKAVKELGLTREWCYTPRKHVPCQFCGTEVLEGVAMCKTCNGILDVEKAYAGGIINETQRDALRAARANRGRGKKGGNAEPTPAPGAPGGAESSA